MRQRANRNFGRINMRIGKALLVIGIVCTVFTVMLIPQTDKSIHAESPTPTTVPSATPDPATNQSELDTEVIALRAQLEVMRQYDERLLETVYWALGTAVALILFAAGAGWYANFRSYQRDKESLKRELHLDLQSSARETSESLHSQANQRIGKIEQSALQTVENATGKLRAQIEELGREIAYLTYQSLQKDAERWRDQNIRSNELRSYMQMLPMARRLGVGYEWAISDTLQKLQEVLKAGAQPDAEEVREITNLIDSLPGEYTIEVQRLRELLLSRS
jgi:hypothetical protein